MNKERHRGLLRLAKRGEEVVSSYARIELAAMNGAGVRLSWEECQALANDHGVFGLIDSALEDEEGEEE